MRFVYVVDCDWVISSHVLKCKYWKNEYELYGICICFLLASVHFIPQHESSVLFVVPICSDDIDKLIGNNVIQGKSFCCAFPLDIKSNNQIKQERCSTSLPCSSQNCAGSSTQRASFTSLSRFAWNEAANKHAFFNGLAAFLISSFE